MVGKTNKGAYTFKNTSIIDYAILSAETLNFFADFEIRETDALYSDGHALSVTTLKFQKIVRVTTPISVKNQNIKQNGKQTKLMRLYQTLMT